MKTCTSFHSGIPRPFLAAALAATLLVPGRSLASAFAAAATVECSDGAHVVTVGGSYFDPIIGEYDHLELLRKSIGVCEPDVWLVDSPLPFEPVDQGGYSSFTATITLVPPRQNVAYIYAPYAVRPDGSRQLISANCDMDPRGYALTACGTAPFLRGRVEFDSNGWDGPYFRIAACEADCWTEHFNVPIRYATLTAAAGESAYALVGRVVDVFGGRTYCGMVGDPLYAITRVARTTDNACGSVPVDAEAWGTVKATYR